MSIHVESTLREAHAGARVLLAEDDVVNQHCATAMLERVGLEVVVAADGLEAVAQARIASFDLVLMDLQMPGLDGLSATRAIRQLSGYFAVPILAHTSTVHGPLRQLCFQAGMDDLLTKPATADELYRRLLHWLNVSRLRCLPVGHAPQASGPMLHW